MDASEAREACVSLENGVAEGFGASDDVGLAGVGLLCTFCAEVDGDKGPKLGGLELKILLAGFAAGGSAV